MTKAQLIASVEARTLHTVRIFEEVDTNLNASGVKRYIMNVMEESSETVRAKNVMFYVKDEGGAGEEAWLGVKTEAKNVVRAQAEAYLAGLVPATYQKAYVTTVNEDHVFAIATVIEVVGAVATEKEIFIYNDGGIIHKDFVRK